MKRLLLLKIILAASLSACVSAGARSPTVLNYKNIETFWNYCTACIQGNCEDAEICKKRMDQRLLLSEFRLAVTHTDLKAISFFLDVIKIDPNAILEDRYKSTALNTIAYYHGPNTEKAAQLLIDRGADVNHIRGSHARTSLLTAI